MNGTHDPRTRSWVASANDPTTDFPIQNLPFGVFRRRTDTAPPRVGVAIGDRVLDVHEALRAGVLTGDAAAAAERCDHPTLNPLMEMGPRSWSALRKRLIEVLRAGATEEATLRPLLVPQSEAEMFLPARIGDYTDFYASVHHATNVGRLFRPDNPLLPNYKWVPIGYHGRASSVVPSGTPIVRPHGQTRAPDAAEPVFGPTRRLDYECEVGVLVGTANDLGDPVPIDRAEDHIFGVCLVNDWSARDLQAWEYQPLGPFLAKSFATSVSPWVVTMEALEPFRVPLTPRPEGDPAPLPYLSDARDRERGGLDLTVEVWLRTATMRAAGSDPVRLSRANTADLYWTFGQMLAHHTSNGCNLKAGDLFATGTVSGAETGSGGCLLELTRGGAEPIRLPNGEERRFLEDGDEVILRGFCQGAGAARIGFGACSGAVLGR